MINMKRRKSMIWLIFVTALCAVGASLLGYNAGKLTALQNIVLYITGLVLVCLSVTILGMGKWINRRGK